MKESKGESGLGLGLKVSSAVIWQALCVCECAGVCVRVCEYVCLCKCMSVHVCASLCACKCVSVHVCAHASV